jgi:hypothetical protein
MSTRIPTLKDLFLTDRGEPREAGSLPAPPAALAPVLGRLQWKSICDHALALADISVLDVMVGAWKKHADFRKHLRVSAADPAKVIVMPLGSHRVVSEHRPSMDVRCDGHVVATVTFPIEVTFQVEAAQLTLQGGAVTEVRLGEVKVSGTVKVENTVIFERDLEAIRLPGKMVLSDEPTARVSSAIPVAAEPRQPVGEYVLLR